jgi:hypothetical protein
MRTRALLLTLLLATPAQAQVTGAWGERGLPTMPDARVGNDRAFEVGTRLVAISGLPTALLGYGRFSFMATEATLLYGIPGHDWPALSLKHQLQRPTRDNPTAVAIGLGLLGAPAAPGIPGSNLSLSLTRDVNVRRDGRDWTLFSAHLGFRAHLDLQARLMAGLELPLGQHGAATVEWIGPTGSESGYANFGLNLSPFPAFGLSLFSLGLPNASLLDRGLAIGASFSGTVPDWQPRKASTPAPAPTAKIAPTPTPAADNAGVKAISPAKPAAPVASGGLPSVPSLPVPAAVVVPVVPLPAVPPLPVTAGVPLAPAPAPTATSSMPSVPRDSALKPPAAPAGTVIGRAVDAAGKAIAGARVILSAKGAAAREATSTPSGYFTFAGLANGSYTVALLDKEGRTLATQSVTLAGSTLEFTLKPQALARMKGRIVDAQTGAPVAGAAVTVGKERSVSDRDGYFDLDGLGAGPWTVAVSAKGYVSSETRVSDAQPRLALKPQLGTVSGRILTAAGKPVSGAIAQIGDLRAASDASGRYALTEVPPGEHTLTLIQDGKALFKAPITLSPGGKVVKDAKVREAAPVGRFGMIGGQVRDAAGKALQGVKIVVEGKAVTILVVTDDAGRFTVQELLPGDYQLKLSKGSYAAQVAKAQVKAGLQASLDVTMRGL